MAQKSLIALIKANLSLMWGSYAFNKYVNDYFIAHNSYIFNILKTYPNIKFNSLKLSSTYRIEFNPDWAAATFNF